LLCVTTGAGAALGVGAEAAGFGAGDGAADGAGDDEGAGAGLGVGTAGRAFTTGAGSTFTVVPVTGTET
jgi:hypothetical protein